MARNRSFVRGARAIGSVRLTQWSSTAPETQFVALAAATTVIDSSFVTSGNNRETSVRVRGLLTVMTDQAAASEQPFGAFGVCVVSDQAFSAGAASVPAPYTNADSDLWLLHEFWACPMLVGDSTGFGSAGVQAYVLDSKAMRKVSEDETLIAVIQNANATDGVLYRLDFRILSKLS